MIGYKLTTQDLKTFNNFQWEIGKKVITSGKGQLCSAAYIHYYDDPLLALIFDPIHANILNPKLFKVEVSGEVQTDRGRKFGCTEMTLLEEIPMPEISVTQKVAFAILCAKKVYTDKACTDRAWNLSKPWNLWSDKWLSNEDRAAKAADSAARAAEWAKYASADWVAAYAARYAAYAAADAEYAAEWAAKAAAYATEFASIDLKAIIQEALKY